MSEGVHVRQVRLADLDACAHIEDVCYGGHGATRNRIERRIREYPEGFWVAVSGNRVIGFVNSGCVVQDDIGDERLKDLDGHNPAGTNRVIFSLAVQPSFQGLGISRLLMDRFIRESTRSGKVLILLICRRKHVPLYERFGFVYRRPALASYGGFKWHEMARPLS